MLNWENMDVSNKTIDEALHSADIIITIKMNPIRVVTGGKPEFERIALRFSDLLCKYIAMMHDIFTETRCGEGEEEKKPKRSAPLQYPKERKTRIKPS